jgi:leucyl/phenylalanyl-tRNA---protein transferase
MERPLQWLDPDALDFPAPATALQTPNGLLAVGGDLRPERLLRAYQRGIFPWFEEGQPPLWWSPDPRMVLFPGELHISRSLRRFIRNTSLQVTSDRAFAAVMAACADPRAGSNGTWITGAMQQAYGALHLLGYAHSVEVWDGTSLVGGFYGVALGNVFFGESMFSRSPNASKLGFAHAITALAAAGYRLIDCQVETAHLANLGARCIPRQEFLLHLPAGEAVPKPPLWPLQ